MKNSRLATVALFLLTFIALIALPFPGWRGASTYDLAKVSLQPSHYPLGTFIKGRKVATIIETRPRTNIAPLLLHFASVLGPEWPIVWFTNSTTPGSPQYTDSAPLRRLIDRGGLKIVQLPKDLNITFSIQLSVFLTEPWLWEQLAPADHVLFFQTDSILCANSNRTVDDFLEYDWVGAPLTGYFGNAFNGGLSLRNRNMVIQIITQSNFKKELKSLTENEDQWYYEKLIELPAKEDGSPGAKLPDKETAKGFAVQMVWDERPVGYHQVQLWNKEEEKLRAIESYCPEWRLMKEGWWE